MYIEAKLMSHDIVEMVLSVLKIKSSELKIVNPK